MKYMTNVLSVVNGLFTRTVRTLYPEFTQLKNTVQNSAKFGDYKCMVAMPLAQVGQYYVAIAYFQFVL